MLLPTSFLPEEKNWKLKVEDDRKYILNFIVTPIKYILNIIGHHLNSKLIPNQQPSHKLKTVHWILAAKENIDGVLFPCFLFFV